MLQKTRFTTDHLFFFFSFALLFVYSLTDSDFYFHHLLMHHRESKIIIGLYK